MSRSKKITFQNSEGNILTGFLELPLTSKPHNFAVFAHCFTCNKNFFAVRNICNALTAEGFGVLRFDFTGLGESEGDFEDTNFSGNIDDLVAATKFLEDEYTAPTLLIGHSLGGAASIIAANKLKHVKAVVTIGSPYGADHVKNLIEDDIDTIEKNGVAKVSIGGRPFNIKKQFIKDLDIYKDSKFIKNLNKSILILHSPQDSLVNISNAEKIYIEAKHPKSFISLDGANHLLTNDKDSIYAGKVIASWASRYVLIPEVLLPTSKHQVIAELGVDGYTTQIKAGNHHFIADEPENVGGDNFGPTPYDLVSASLAACTSMTIQMYARRKKWMIESVETHVNYKRDYFKDCETCEIEEHKIDIFERDIVIKSNLKEDQINRILEIANKCPVHKTLLSPTRVISTIQNNV